jgi:hypothetical protein
MSRKLVTVAETPLFLRQAKDVWDESEREDFVNFIARNPEAGDVIPDSGGVRKLRWGRSGSGKRGGARVIYFYHDAGRPLYLLNGLCEGATGRHDTGREAHGAQAGRNFEELRA